MLSDEHAPQCENAHGKRYENAHETTEKAAQLGKNAKSRATVDLEGKKAGVGVDRKTGEIVTKKPDPAAVRCERYALQSVVRSLLPASRTANCLRVRQGNRQEIDVWRSKAHGSASYAGLQTCGSVWLDPVCSAKISERRRAELKTAIGTWTETGGAVWLLTLTHPHTARDTLAELLEAEQRALHGFFTNRAGKALKVSLGLAGHVRAWEVTHGRLRTHSNGWHPHFHILLFLRELPGDIKALEAEAFKVWANACRSAGLAVPSAAHGVSLDDGAKAAEYVSKMGLEDPRANAPTPEPQAPVSGWGLDAEMTKGHTKKAKDGETPFDLLRAVFATKDAEAGRLFCEFAAAFHGKRQLAWSRGLRDLLGLGREETDGEIEAHHEPDAELLGSLTLDEWRAVVAADLRAELLELARHGWEPVRRLLDSLIPR